MTGGEKKGTEKSRGLTYLILLSYRKFKKLTNVFLRLSRARR
jgi:hypothetical protein